MCQRCKGRHEDGVVDACGTSAVVLLLDQRAREREDQHDKDKLCRCEYREQRGRKGRTRTCTRRKNTWNSFRKGGMVVAVVGRRQTYLPTYILRLHGHDEVGLMSYSGSYITMDLISPERSRLCHDVIVITESNARSRSLTHTIYPSSFLNK